MTIITNFSTTDQTFDKREEEEGGDDETGIHPTPSTPAAVLLRRNFSIYFPTAFVMIMIPTALLYAAVIHLKVFCVPLSTP